MSKTKDDKLLEKEELKKVKKTQQDEKKKLAAEKKEKKKEEREKKKEEKKKRKEEKTLEKEEKQKSKVKEEKMKKKTKSSDEAVVNDTVIKEKKSIFDIFLKFILFISIGASIFAVYELYLLDSIENNLRYAAMGVLAFIDLLLEDELTLSILISVAPKNCMT